ncbi:MAG: transcriptional regulator, partial [Oxalobacteraceae bacterium]
PTYSEARRTMAKSIGLGRKPDQKNEAKAEAAKPAPRKRKADDTAE